MDEKKKSKSPSFMPYYVIASVLYFIVSIGVLFIQDYPLISAGLYSVVTFVIMTGVILFFAKQAQKKTEEFIENGGKDSPADESKKTDYRRQLWIDGLRREAGKKRTSIIRMLAFVTFVLSILFFATSGVSPAAYVIASLWIVVTVWLLQLILPRWMVYLAFSVIWLIQFTTVGPQILQFLPNIIFLPIFYLLMMFFMYGSIMLPNLAQIKYHKPGEGSWEVEEGSMQGQAEAKAIIDTQIDRFVRYAKGETDRKPTRGIVFTGPPGTGKTLYATEIASRLGLPFVNADASAFNAPFMGFGQLIPLIVRARSEKMAKEFGGLVVFIDEGEILFGARSGMQQPQSFTREIDLYDVLENHGLSMFDAPHVRDRVWYESQMSATEKTPQPSGIHKVFMMPGGMGGNAGIFPFLTWMSGAKSAPMSVRLLRSTINNLLDSLFFVPVTAFGKVLRLPPAKAKDYNILFITATNRFFMFDPAMLRPGRFGITAEFKHPDEEGRAQIAKLYLNRWKKYYQPELLTDGRITEFAQSTINASPAEIEQMVEEAVDCRSQHLAELRRVKRFVDEGRHDQLLAREKKFWARFKKTVYDQNGKEITGWNDEKVDWHALMETKSSIGYGKANPEAVNESTRRKVAFHEYSHFMALNAFNGKRIKPTLLTVIPRRGSLGMVAHVPHDTREQHPQRFYEGLIRTSVASWVGEHYFYGENLPGVSGDMKNATNVACLMIGKWAMSHLLCSAKDQEYYAKIGEVLISEPETSMFNPMAGELIKSVLHNPQNRRDVAIILGMAAVDDYRLIRKNRGFFQEVIPQFLALDEFAGSSLTEQWQKLDKNLVLLSQMSKKDQTARPVDAFGVRNSNYEELSPEGQSVIDAVYAEVEQKGGVS